MADNPQPSSAAALSDSASPYLSRPASSSTTASSSSNSTKPTATAATKHETRLYIGNLHPSVDEYALVQTFSRFGKISKLDFLFHKSGPQRGQPRGYAFLEYASPQEALQAVVGAHEKTLRGRKISVTFATKNNADTDRDATGGVGPHRRDRRTGGESEAIKTTQLSLAKNAKQPQGRKDRSYGGETCQDAPGQDSSNNSYSSTDRVVNGARTCLVAGQAQLQADRRTEITATSIIAM
ncbi:uncharacterized protein UTRI_05142 [Ustilago trichophora]|uniref:Probable RNA-binding protein 18 n=1 Tax=Ustilago trichophora TaxID=86804 RepID=A0A5C3EFP3_9BASI|nr:uncharacterized protein UTRI_05142 [Ustilago trichophora]